MAGGCPICGGTEFDDGDHVLLGSHGNVSYAPGGGFFRGFSSLGVRARACLRCGYVALFVEDLAELRYRCGRGEEEESAEDVPASEAPADGEPAFDDVVREDDLPHSPKSGLPPGVVEEP